MPKNVIIFFLPFLFFISCGLKKEKAELIVWNAKIYTVDSKFLIAEAMAIRHGKILETGSNEVILGRYESEDTLKLNGLPVYPGFIDAHCHFTGFATDMWKCDLKGTNSFEEVLQKIKSYATTAPMHWIYGRGWDQNDWENKNFPDKSQLDLLFPDRPVFLKRIDGHAALVNQNALDRFGINSRTKVNGGEVVLKNGKLTGILIDNAMDLIDLNIPPISDSLAKQYYSKAQELCFAQGLTGVHDCGISEHTFELLEQEQKTGNLKMKVYALLSDDSTYYERWLKKGPYKGERLKVGGFKIYTDGALGSRGACLIHSYSDKENWHGFLLTSRSRMQKIARQLVNSSFQMCSHAIGDSANRLILKIYAEALKGKNNKRWRVEHAQVMHPSDFHYFKEYSIVPSVQPTHATSDMYWAADRLGKERLKYAYAYKSLLDTAGLIALGTDFPVEDISPLKTFYAAVVRKDEKDFPKHGFQMRDALDREESLKGMTIWAAYSAFEEEEKGSLEKGKAADFVILDKDLLTCHADSIKTTKVLRTYINAELVYRSN